MTIRIPSLLRWLTAFEVNILLVSGLGLLLFPNTFGQHWAWQLSPFNANLISAIYLASMVSALALVIFHDWSTARFVLPMIATFTIIVLGLSIMYFDRFVGPTYAVLLWFTLYILIPLNAIAHLWFYRRYVVMSNRHISGRITTWLHCQSISFGAYGMALLLLPQWSTQFWFWQIDDFHARLYSVAFITPALGAYLLTQYPQQRNCLILGSTQMVGGLLPIIAVLIVNQATNQIVWSQMGTWVWFGLFAFIALSGVSMVWIGFASCVPSRPTRFDRIKHLRVFTSTLTERS